MTTHSATPAIFNMKNSDSSDSSDDEGMAPVTVDASRPESTNTPDSSVKHSEHLDIVSNCGVPKSHKRFSIWSDVLMEQALTEEFQGTLKPGSSDDTVTTNGRGVEDYAIPKKRKDTRKMPEKWIPDHVEKGGRRRNREHPEGEPKPKSKNHREKKLSEADILRLRNKQRKKKNRKHRTDEDKTALEIANALHEPKIALISAFFLCSIKLWIFTGFLFSGKSVAVVGIPLAQRIFKEVLDVEDAGGLLTSNGLRRRSPGGSYFQMLKTDKHVTQQQKDQIFAVEQALFDQKRKLSRNTKRTSES